MAISIRSVLLTICILINASNGSILKNDEHGNLSKTSSDLSQGLNDYPISSKLADTKTQDFQWFVLPWHHVRTYLQNNYDGTGCNDSPENFPDDIFTDEQLRQGAIILHFIAVIYSFSFLAVVCNDYFIPAVECICEDLHLSKDVAAATFMASATSCPELFANVMGTFVTKSDLGIGTIVGSALFNALGVSAIGGLAAAKPILIEKWPVRRDSLIYIFNVIILVIIVWDDKIMWYESTVLVCMYFLYFFLMFNNNRIIALFKRCTGRNKKDPTIDSGAYIAKLDSFEHDLSEKTISTITLGTVENAMKEDLDDQSDSNIENTQKIRKSLCHYPLEKTMILRIWFIYTWPIKLILTCSIPSPKTIRFLYPLSFIICIVWIGVISYFVSWMLTIIGNMFEIPDSIMGMTFLAFGGCLPEACSIFILSRKGKGDMGISNSLGANSLAILFSLGIPWFAKAMFLRANGEEGFIEINSSGMNFIVLSLILVIICLNIIFQFGKFYLKKKTGVIIFAFYLVFVTLFILTEAGIFFDLHLPEC